MEKKEKWDKKQTFEDIDRFLKQGTLNSRIEEFSQRLEQDGIAVPEDWQEVFNTLFENMLDEYPAFACCILAFQAVQVWQKYYGGELCP